jgi:hypothetical protein
VVGVAGMSAGLGILAFSTSRLVQAVAEETVSQLNIAKVLAAIAGFPMPEPGCTCTTCTYRWQMIRRFLPREVDHG